MGALTYVFCHGLNGSGRYDEGYAKNPYWGSPSGDVVAGLRALGYAAYAASVSPQGSAWDRACELYAQIAGVRVDYGRAHSETYRHARFGRDFTGDPLIPVWDDTTRLVLIGHSFGGVTVRLLTELLAHGCEREREVTPESEVSPLFCGGLESRIAAVVTLAAPTNGTTAYDLALDPTFDEKSVRVPLYSRILDRIVKASTEIKRDGRDERDWADCDMTLDAARAINERISTLPNVCYLAVPCDATVEGEDGTRVIDPVVQEPLFVCSSLLIAAYRGTTAGGIVADETWHANDGLVSTVSAGAPAGAPARPLQAGHLEPGVWSVMETQHVNHCFFQGGLMKKCDPMPFFTDLMHLLETLE